MKFNYKWPIVSNTTAQQAILNKQTNQEVSTSTQTLGIGITTVIFYFITIFYIYSSGAINKQKIPLNNVMNETISAFKNRSIFYLNTFSGSCQNTEKIGTTVLLVIFLALLQGLFSSQNISGSDMKRATIVAFNYVIVLCWLLFLYIFPDKNTSTQHLILAIFVLVSLIINCFLIANLYNDYFDEKTIEPLVAISYTMVSFAGIAGGFMLLNAYFNNSLKYLNTHTAVAYTEMSCLILFGIFMIIFIQFPPLPTNQLSCVMIP